MSFWTRLRAAPPSLSEIFSAEPLLKHIDPASVERSLALLVEIAFDAAEDPVGELIYQIDRRRFGPRPVLRLLVRAVLRLAGRRLEPITFAGIFEPGPPSPRAVFTVFKESAA